MPAPGGSARFRLEAMAAGCALAEPAGVERQPELAAAALARLAEDEALREREGAEARAAAEAQSFDRVAAELDEHLPRPEPGAAGAPARRRPARRPRVDRRRPAHAHELVARLLDPGRGAARPRRGRGARRDRGHRPQRLRRRARGGASWRAGRDLIVIPGEEVKTDGQGEVIGLFLDEEIPRGMSFADTVAAIREQEGLVYLPHPFDRMHAIPDPATLHRHLAEIDVLEVYNARLLFEAYNDEALRFARKYGLLAGAGLGRPRAPGRRHGRAAACAASTARRSSCSRCARAEVLRRPKSLAYLQSLKWVAQVKEKVR